MKYLRLSQSERTVLLKDLAEMPDFLAERFGELADDAATKQGASGGFSPVEHCWHLADLEREGYGVRIARLLREANPSLPDFDGVRIAAEREYRRKSLPAAIEAFREARRANVAIFCSLSGEEWERAGTQEAVGPVALCDVPCMMAQHDDAHKAEIEAWFREQ